MTPEALRDAVLAYLAGHEHTCPVGRAECREHVNIIAFLAHCAGVRAAKVDELQRHIMIYEESCEQCPHWRN